MLLLLVILNVFSWPMLFLGCGKLRRWRQKQKQSKNKLNSSKQPCIIPVTPHPQLKSGEESKPEQTIMRTRTVGTPATASVRVADQNVKKTSVVLPLRPSEDQGQPEEPTAVPAEKLNEAIHVIASSVPQPRQKSNKENSQETKENAQRDEENKNVEKKGELKRGPTKDTRAETRKRSVPCKTGKEADRLVDTSGQRMSPENTLRDVPRTMPEYSINYEKCDMDPMFQDSQLL